MISGRAYEKQREKHGAAHAWVITIEGEGLAGISWAQHADIYEQRRARMVGERKEKIIPQEKGWQKA